MLTNTTTVPGTALEVVSLALAKSQLRLESSYTFEDALITSYIKTAVKDCENYTGGFINPATVTLTFSGFVKETVLEQFPVTAITSVKFLPADGSAELTLEVEKYELLLKNGKQYTIAFGDDLPATVKSNKAVTVVLTVGYTSNTIPPAVVQAVLLKISDMYERREDRMEVPLTVADKLLRPYKMF
jgi:uncharacterized phiE125 gp8 family phage protein